MHPNDSGFAKTSEPGRDLLPEVTRPCSSVRTKQHALRIVIAAQLIAFLATYMIYFTSIVLVEEKTHSSAQMGMMVFSSTLAGFLFALPAGATVDRHNQVRLLVVSNVLRMGIAVGFSAITFRFSASRLLLPFIYTSNLALSAIATVSMSAEGSLIPRMVKPKRLLATNSIIQASLLGAQGAGIVGLSPALFKLGGASLVGGVAALLCVLSAWLCARLPTSTGQARSTKTHRKAGSSFWTDLRAGWRFITTNSGAGWATVQVVLVSTLSLTLVTVLPVWVARGWGLSVENTAYLAVPGGIGFGVGMWFIGQRGHWLEKEIWASIGLLALGGGMGVLSAIPALRGYYVAVYAFASVGIGTGFALVSVSGKTVLQVHSPHAIRGCVIATQLFLSSAASTLPLPVVGKLADVFGFQRVFALLAVIVVSMGIASLVHAVMGSGTSRTSPRRTQSSATFHEAGGATANEAPPGALL